MVDPASRTGDTLSTPDDNTADPAEQQIATTKIPRPRRGDHDQVDPPPRRMMNEPGS